ncbi:hypothetical protein ACLB2K_019756 [Fragaria x ananassa]
MTLGKAKIVCKVMGETNKKEVADNLLRIIFNSSSVVDPDLGHLGKGLYLLISLMNHSCLPNCIVVFEGKRAFVRAVEPIAKGAEICQSYINLSGSTMSRKMTLEGEYLFTCTCPRCIEGEHHDILERAYVEGYRCSANGCDGALLSNSDGNEFICQKCKCLRSKEEITKLKTEIELQMNALEAAQTIAMNLKDWKEALAYCKLIIEQYQGLCPGYNVLLGLEYYRCGKFQGPVLEGKPKRPPPQAPQIRDVPLFATVRRQRRRASIRADSSSAPDHFPSPTSPPNSSFLARSILFEVLGDLAGKLEFGELAGEGKWSGTLLESARVEAHRRWRRTVANGGTSAL